MINLVINGIILLNSKLFYMALLGCKQLIMYDIIITVSGNSFNTDGIYIGRSDGVNIININIGTGDDCIFIGDGVKNFNIEKITCGSGYGISVGSLGRYFNEESVTGVIIKGCVIKDADNGVRVKIWYNLYFS